MSHLDEGTIVAIRDGGSADLSSLEHVDQCAVCPGLIEDARARSVLVAGALSALDEPVDARAARSAIRARLDSARTAHRLSAWRRWHLGRAATILLLTAGAASALPWSPVRSWWGGPEAAPEPPGGEGLTATEDVPAGGIAMDLPDGRIQVIVRGAAPGSGVDVFWLDQPTARITAPAGSGFTYADGRAQVDAVPGLIRVELPREAELATLEVDGLLYLRRSPTGLQVPGPAVESTEEGIRFLVPGG